MSLQCLGQVSENYVLAIQENALADAQKHALLMHCLGTEGQRDFSTLTDADNSYKTALTALRISFVPRVNVVAERYKFRQRGQKNGASTEQYIASLREMVVTWEFGELADEMIRDQLIEKTNSPRIRELLLLEMELALQKALTMAIQIESAIAGAQIIGQGIAHDIKAIHPVQTQDSQSSKRPF